MESCSLDCERVDSIVEKKKMIGIGVLLLLEPALLRFQKLIPQRLKGLTLQ